MFGSPFRLLAASFQFAVGALGVLVLSFSLLIALAAPAASAAGPSMGRAPGMSFAPAAALDLSRVDDLRATSRVSSAPRLAVRAAGRLAEAVVFGA